MKDKISIIIPSYNSIEYIKECINSVLNQSFSNLEILCIDAYSTDGTLEFLLDISKQDFRIKIIMSDIKSLGYQINLGIDNASGKYLCIVESDDYISKYMCEKLYKTIRDNNVDIVKADIVSFKNTIFGKKYYYNNILYIDNFYNKVITSDFREDIIKNSWNMNQSSIFNLDFIKKNKIKANETLGASYQDFGFWFWICSCFDKIYFLKEALYYYRKDNINSSSNSKEKIYCVCNECDFIEKNIIENNKKLINIFYYIKFKIYMWNLYRIKKEYRLEFLNKILNDFINVEQGNLVLFNKNDINNLRQILDNPFKFSQKINSRIDFLRKFYARCKRKILCKIK
ncbi:glycosyltransferase family 2 protein [Campylobacter volucris]|uniref:glycosyltransferase family 2 protein n=1 Tax=Campylobacter volucris TaxID=1031542 RepID=UPI00189CAB70|nr:glycosyltransferase family 2 protein [Campylobacter volucris]MBF7045278.1 glycosyltransferase family 2 protein [Campylobacter volucris]